MACGEIGSTHSTCDIKDAYGAGEIASIWCSGARVCSYMYICYRSGTFCALGTILLLIAYMLPFTFNPTPQRHVPLCYMTPLDPP